MNFFRSILCVGTLLAAGCKARAPAVALECVKHQDCKLVGLEATCCDACQPRVGNVASIDGILAWCAAHPPKDCPSLKCPDEAFTAMCQDGRCVARPGVHPL